MGKPQGPCQGCVDRRAEIPEKGQRDCHRSCDRYKQFTRELAKYNKTLDEKIQSDRAATFRPWRHRRNANADKE